MAPSYSSIFLLASITLAYLCHTEAAGSVAGARTADLKAKSAVQGASNVAKKYLKGSTGNKAATCVEVFGDAVAQLNKCLGELKDPLSALSKSNVQTWGSAAMTSVDTCSDEFGAGIPADLKKATDNAHSALSSFLAIVNRL